MKSPLSWTSSLAALLLLAVGCRTPLVSEETVEIENQAQYKRVLEVVQKETEKPLQKVELGEPLAREDLEKIGKNIPRARGLAAFAPNSFGPRLLLAKLLRAGGAADQALEEYETAISLTPARMTPAEATAQAAGRADLAGIYFGRREFRKAEDELREALRLTPDSVVFRVNLVQVLLESRQKDEAKRVLAEAEKLNPNSAGVKSLKALIYPKGTTSSPPTASGRTEGS